MDYKINSNIKEFSKESKKKGKMGKAKMNKLENRKHTEVLNLRAGYLKKANHSFLPRPRSEEWAGKSWPDTKGAEGGESLTSMTSKSYALCVVA